MSGDVFNNLTEIQRNHFGISPDDSTCKRLGIVAKSAAIGFVSGVIWGVLSGSSVAVAGTVMAVRQVSAVLFSYAFAHIGKALNWTYEATRIVTEATNVLCGIAMIVACVALGIFGPIGVTLASLGMAFNLFQMVQAARAYAALPREPAVVVPAAVVPATVAAT